MYNTNPVSAFYNNYEQKQNFKNNALSEIQKQDNLMVSRVEHQNQFKSNKNQNDQRNLFSQPPNLNSQNKFVQKTAADDSDNDVIDDEDVKGRRKMIKNGY